MREFDYKEEDYKKEDGTLDTAKLLVEHSKFVEGGFKEHISPDDLETKFEEMTKTKMEKEDKVKQSNEKKNALIESLIPNNILPGRKKAFIALANVSNEDTSESLTIKFNKVKEDNEFFFQENFLPKKVVEVVKSKKDLKKEILNEQRLKNI